MTDNQQVTGNNNRITGGESPLWRRVQRHTAVATLFRASEAGQEGVHVPFASAAHAVPGRIVPQAPIANAENLISNAEILNTNAQIKISPAQNIISPAQNNFPPAEPPPPNPQSAIRNPKFEDSPHGLEPA